MADLIRTLEADLFGAYEAAADLYADLVDVPEAPDRLAVHRGLMRCYEALEGKADESMRAAEGMVEAEDALDETERALLAPLEAPREKLFAQPDAQTAAAYLAAFDAAWSGRQQQALLSDAMLAAIAHSNVIAATRNKTLPPETAKKHHEAAGVLYEEINALLVFRMGTGSALWRETAQSALYRAMVAWRFAGDEARSKRAQSIAGPPAGFEGQKGGSEGSTPQRGG